METNRRLQLFASAIALQQMHGHAFAEAFLEEQGICNSEAKKITCWATNALPQAPFPDFGYEFHRAIIHLLYFPEFSKQFSRFSYYGPHFYTSVG